MRFLMSIVFQCFFEAFQCADKLMSMLASKSTVCLTRVAEDVIFYEYTVTDPELFTQPWKGEMPLWRAEGPIYEYACHEANYSLPGILAGARREEQLASDAMRMSSGSE